MAYVLASRAEADVLLAAEQDGEVVVQPAAAVVACVHNHSLFVALKSEELVVNGAEAGRIHALHVDVSNAAAGYGIHNGAVALHITAV